MHIPCKNIHSKEQPSHSLLSSPSGIDPDDSLRDAMKREEWLAVTSEKLNYSSEVYSIDVAQSGHMDNHHHHHHHHALHHPKQNGVHQPPGSEYYKDIYAVQSPAHSQFEGEQGDYTSYAAMIGQEQNVDTGEIWGDKSKETTSFEHEQPHSSSIVPR